MKTLFTIYQSRKTILINSSAKAIQVLVLLFLFTTSYAQEFYGTVSVGSQTLFKVNGDGSGYRQVSLNVNNGTNSNPYFGSSGQGNRLNPFSNGKFYGVALGGGLNDASILFEFDPLTKEYSELKELDYYNNCVPTGDMIEYNGKLYGSGSGLGNPIYSFDPVSKALNTEYSLPSHSSGLILVNNKFYGMTRGGGVQRAGAIFEFNPDTKAYKVLFQFNRTSTGHYPDGVLTYANGKLYGATTVGGKHGKGTLFEFNLSTNQFSKKIDLNAKFISTTLLYFNNKLYGWGNSGGANDHHILSEFDLSTGILRKVFDFSPEFPAGTLSLFNQTLYGTSNESLFSINLQTFEYSTLFEFNTDENGTYPFGQVILYGNSLMGMTAMGGKANGGTIFKYNIASDQVETELSFGYSPQGKNMVSMIEVGDSFYGLLNGGGENNSGTLVKINPANFSITKLHDFNCSECENPGYLGYTEGQLLKVDNTLYGIFTKNGALKGGELFSYDLDAGSYSKLVEFNTPEKGMAPIGNIVVLNGKIFGTTQIGGSEDIGFIFEYDIANQLFQVKKSLMRSTTGWNLRFTKANNALYALGSGGPLGKGVLSTYDPVTNTLTHKYQFQNAADGQYPMGSLMLRDSKLIGRTSGVIFEFDLQTQLYRKILSLHVYYSIGSRVIHQHNLYETLEGIIYEFNLDTQVSKELVSFNSTYLNNVSYGGPYITTLVVRDGDFQTTPPVLTQVIEFNQGKRKDQKTIEAAKSNPTQALYSPDVFDNPNNGIKFVSLGFGGSITLGFDIPVNDRPGIDLYIAETSYGDPSFNDYPEQAEVFVSQDAVTWVALGNTHDHSSQPGSVSGPHEACRGKLDSEFDLQPSGLAWIQYVKIVDVTDPLAMKRDRNMCLETGAIAFNAASDGFDLDAISPVSNQFPRSPSARSASGTGTALVDISAPNATAQLYPNPTSHSLTINLAEEQELAIMEDNFHLEIIDTRGKTWTNSRELMDDSWTIHHDVSKLQPGMYIARLKNGNVRRNYKFIKN